MALFVKRLQPQQQALASVQAHRDGHGLGLLGPVDDTSTMAANVVRLWNRGAKLVGARARSMVVENYGWHRTFKRLFDEIYPAARARAAERFEEDGAKIFRRRKRRDGLPVIYAV